MRASSRPNGFPLLVRSWRLTRPATEPHGKQIPLTLRLGVRSVIFDFIAATRLPDGRLFLLRLRGHAWQTWAVVWSS